VTGELPEGWASIQLRNAVATIQNGPFGSLLHRSDYVSGGVPLINPTNIRDGKLIPDQKITIPRDRARELENYLMRAGDVVLGRRGEMGRAALVSPERDAWFCGTGCAFVRTGMAVHSPFLALWFGSPSVRAQLEGDSVGATMSNLSTRIIGNLDLSLPPLPEQRRIVETVEALFKQIHAARDALANVPIILKRFRQSVLAAACSGELIESVPVSEEWPETALRDLLIDARYGTSDRCRERIRGAVPVLRVPNIASGRLDLTSLKFAVPQRNWASLMVEDGDILICRTNGSLDLVGKAAVVADLSEPAAFASYLIRLRTNTEALLPRFLHLFLMSPSGRDQITAEARTTAGQFNLNLEILRGLRFALPPVDAQAEIVRRVDLLFSLAGAIEHRVTAASVRADTLIQSVLAKAFRGELVPTEAELARAEARDYEPADALVARIHSQRAVSSPRPKSRPHAARRGARS
jgi:type I restriction enzyme S subunit